jgi:hypothetical protein
MVKDNATLAENLLSQARVESDMAASATVRLSRETAYRLAIARNIREFSDRVRAGNPGEPAIMPLPEKSRDE